MKWRLPNIPLHLQPVVTSCDHFHKDIKTTQRSVFPTNSWANKTVFAEEWDALHRIQKWTHSYQRPLVWEPNHKIHMFIPIRKHKDTFLQYWIWFLDMTPNKQCPASLEGALALWSRGPGFLTESISTIINCYCCSQ